MQNIQEIVEQSDRLYAARERVEQVEACAELLSAASESEFAAAWRLARAYFFLGQEATARERVREFHRRGALAAERALALEGTRVEGHFWRGVNLALRAQAEPLWRALGLALKARASLLRAVRMDAAYHAAGPLRVLARLEHRLPRGLGGGHARARRHFVEALRLAPESSVTRLYFAELLLSAGERRGARAQLEALLAAPTDADWAFEARRDRERARRMLAALAAEE